MYCLKEKVALVTGGAHGIGKEVVKELLAEGAKHVAILDIDKSAGHTLESALVDIYGKNKVKFLKCDITKDNELFDAYKTTSDEHGYIDIVINNAGIGNESLDMYKTEIAINFTALVTSTLKALEFMRVDKGGKGGTIINVSSGAALTISLNSLFIYSATKSAVLHFTTNIGRKPYSERTKVRTLTMCYGFTRSNIFNNVANLDKDIVDRVNKIMEIYPWQTSQSAARGLVEAYKQGESGSIWYVSNNKPASDITDKVNQAYDILNPEKM